MNRRDYGDSLLILMEMSILSRKPSTSIGGGNSLIRRTYDIRAGNKKQYVDKNRSTLQQKEIEIKAWSTTDKKEAPEVIAVVKKNKVIYNSDCVKIDRYARRIVKEAKEMMLKN